MTFAKRTDRSHKEVVDAFRACGWTVYQAFRQGLGPDLFVAKDGKTFAVEVKGPKTPLQPHQVEWMREWPGDSCIVRTAEDVVILSRAASTPTGVR